MFDFLSKKKAKDKDHLKKLIAESIARNGLNCDLNFIDVTPVTDMSHLFEESDFNGDISKWDMSKVTTMEKMFRKSKFNGDISKWDVSNVTNMEGCFSGSKFNGDISGWNVSNVTNMRSMFYGTEFNGDISKWNVGRVKNMRTLFCGSKFNGDVSKWNVSNVENMESLFEASSFNGDVSNWDVGRVKDMSTLFHNSKFNGDVSNWNVSSVTDMERMFYGVNLQCDLSKWNVSNVSNMTKFLRSNMFEKQKANIGDISNWDLRNCMSTIDPYLVYNCAPEGDVGVVFNRIMRKNLNSKPKNGEELKNTLESVQKWSGPLDFETMAIDLNFINVSNVTDMSHLFENWFSDLNEDLVCNLDISGWDVSNVTNMEAMFQGSHVNVDLSKWNVSKVKNMKDMFADSCFKGDLSKWDVSSVENMSGMFKEIEVKSPLSRWNVGHVKDMSSMFYFSTFNKDISKWDVSHVENMDNMFAGSSFSGDISRWNVSKVKNMTEMFKGSDFHGNLSKWSFAVNATDVLANTAYTEQEVKEMFCKPFTDPRDGEVYKTCMIGTQVWMAENLRFRPLKGGSLAYDKDPKNVLEYGRLYSRDVAKEACPPGWHLPSEEEFNALITFVGNTYNVSDALRKKDWDDALDVFGFKAVPSGLYGNYCVYDDDSCNSYDGIFSNKFSDAFYWLSEKGKLKLWRLGSGYCDLPEVDQDGEFEDDGHWWKFASCYFSIRCIKG